MEAFERKMKDAGLNEAAIAAFKHNYEQLESGGDCMVPESTIEPVQVCMSYRCVWARTLCWPALRLRGFTKSRLRSSDEPRRRALPSAGYACTPRASSRASFPMVCRPVASLHKLCA